MPDSQKRKRFISLPRYGGGSKALKDFIAANLVYPAEALEKRVEGSVIVEYDITDNGTVLNPRVLKGIGYGCDDEALRLIGMLRFEKVKNRGLRVKVTTKTTIHFRLPKITINYTVRKAQESDKPSPEKSKPGEKQLSYNYSVKI
jgi:TonB family protein